MIAMMRNYIMMMFVVCVAEDRCATLSVNSVYSWRTPDNTQPALSTHNSELTVVIGKLDRFFRLRGRRIATAAHAANKYNLIRCEFGSCWTLYRQTGQNTGLLN